MTSLNKVEYLLPDEVYGSLDFLFSDVSGETQKRLYIIAGHSGSGVSALIDSAAHYRAPIFGHDAAKWSYFNALYKLTFCNQRLTGNQPFEVTSGGFLSLERFLSMAQLGLSPALITFLHIDLISAVESLYAIPKDSYWSGRVAALDVDNSNYSWPELFCGFWNEVLVTRLRNTNFYFDNYDEIVVNYVSSSRRVPVLTAMPAEKLSKDSYRRAIEALYTKSSASHGMYSYHLLGWKQWLKGLARTRPVKICTTTTLFSKNRFLIQTEQGLIKLFSRQSLS